MIFEPSGFRREDYVSLMDIFGGVKFFFVLSNRFVCALLILTTMSALLLAILGEHSVCEHFAFLFCLRFEFLPFFVCHKYNRPLLDCFFGSEPNLYFLR